MGRISGNFLSEIFAAKTGNGNLIASGGFFGNPALYLRTNQAFSPAAQNDANGKNEPSGDAKETFWVGKSADAKKIGENLLRESFDFEDSDVRAYKTLYGDLQIFDERQCAANARAGKSCAAATPQQIQKWQTSADGKKVAVTLPAATVKFLHDFRQQRLIERRVMEIVDPELRAQTEKDLRAVATQTGTDRASAFMDLRNSVGQDSPAGKKVSEIVKLIANLPENKDNPFTQMLLAKIELKEISAGETANSNPKDMAKIEAHINRAADLAAGFNETTKLRDPQKAVSRQEAQTLNEEAARLAEQFGKPADARFRTLLARFYEVDDAERAKYEFRKSPEFLVLPRRKDAPTVNSMSSKPKETLEYEQFLRDNPPQNVDKELSEDPQKVEWKTREITDGKGGIKVEAYQQYKIEGSMKPEGIQENKNFIYLDKNGREVEKDAGYERKMPYVSRQTNEREELNRAGTTRAYVTAGAVGAIEEINKWTPFLADLYYGTTAKRVQMFLKLKKADFDANNYPIPPKPERIQQMKRDLLGVRFNTQAEFQRVQWTMKRLEDLSYAFWNR